MKILINSPYYKKPYGGVANFYYGLLPYWQENVKYNVVARRKNISGAIWLPWDILKFIALILFWNPDFIILNPSLDFKAIKRDQIFLLLAKIFRKKCAVYIHGFDMDYSNKINKNLFVKQYNKADCFFVLANSFKNIFVDWGITKPIFLSSAKVYDRLLDNFDITSRNGKIENILFMCRIEKEKGIFIALDSFKILVDKYKFLKLNILGKGAASKEMMEYIKINNIENVNVSGHIPEDELITALIKNDLYFFPTFAGEGMPTSVLEAMAFGLPVVTRPVGGLADFFTNQMGVISESLDPVFYADEIEKLINNVDIVKKISMYNHEYINNCFLASKVAPSIEDALKSLV